MPSLDTHTPLIDQATGSQANGDAFAGSSFASVPLDLGLGDRVGVVLLVPGAPESQEEVFAYLYRRFMKPGNSTSGLSHWTSHFGAQLRARLSARRVIQEYKAIGGGHSINRLNREQAAELARRLKGSKILPEGVKVDTYIASPFGNPSMKQAVAKMTSDGVTHIVLLPLFPQFASETTGRAIAQWNTVIADTVLALRPTTTVWEFAVKDPFIAAINERIDQALQRFPRTVRADVAILFAAHGKTERDKHKSSDPYCCLVHHTVDRIMEVRSNDRTFALSFVRDRGWSKGLGKGLKAELEQLISNGKRSLVVVPVDHVTEQFDTAYLLDVELREVAEKMGITHYHVSSGLNCHSLFMEGLTDLVMDSIVPSGAVSTLEDCIKACPRSSWRPDAEANATVCSVCPFVTSKAGSEIVRPSRVHAASSSATDRELRSRRGLIG